jgi:hypothetical protein
VSIGVKLYGVKFKHFAQLGNKVKFLQHIQQIISMFFKYNIILLQYAWFMMVISLIHPTTCGLAKVIAWQLAKSTQSRRCANYGRNAFW